MGQKYQPLPDDPIQVIHPCCCGVDGHKQEIQACLLRTTASGAVQQEQRTFSTMTEDLLELLDWLLAAGCIHVAMESTGIYWKPLYNLLDGAVEVLVVNPQHIKAVPGRTTDVNDAAWIAGLLRHSLLRASFIPDRAQRELRELTRYRKSLVDEHTAEVNRLQTPLEGANTKVAAEASDILGHSDRAILERLVAGQMDATALAPCARGKPRQKIPELERALAGSFGAHQRFLVARQRAHLDDLDETIAEVSAEIARRLAPFAEEIALLDTVPGVGRETAEALIGEIGTGMGQFPSAGTWPRGQACARASTKVPANARAARRARARAGCARSWWSLAKRRAARPRRRSTTASAPWRRTEAGNARRWRSGIASSPSPTIAYHRLPPPTIAYHRYHRLPSPTTAYHRLPPPTTYSRGTNRTTIACGAARAHRAPRRLIAWSSRYRPSALSCPSNPRPLRRERALFHIRQCAHRL